MKIVYLVHQFFPEHQTGTEKFILNTATMTQKFGNSVKVITYSFYDDSFYDKEFMGVLYKEFYYKGVPIIAFKYTRQPRNMNIVLENETLYKFSKFILMSEKPDLIHIGHLMRVNEFVWVAKELDIPYVITITDFFLLCPKINLTPDKHSLCSGPKGGDACLNLCPEFNHDYITKRLADSKEILSDAKKIIAPSAFVAKLFNMEFPRLNINVINHGMQYDYIKKNNRSYHSQDKIIFGYAGNLIYHKGVHILLEAFKNINSKNAELLIYGTGQMNYIQDLREISGNDSRVRFKGFFQAEQLGDVFNSFDILVTPSICYETYSLILHEALASNVPVIASDLGIMADEIEDEFNGFTFCTADSKELNKIMNKVISDPQLLNQMKANIKSEMVVPTIEQETYKYWQIYKNSVI